MTEDGFPHKFCSVGAKPIKADFKKLRNMRFVTPEGNRAHS